MTFAITLPQPGDRYFFIPAVPAGFLSPPLADAVGRYVTLYTGPARDDSTDDPWGAAARDIAEHVATSCNELAVKLLFIAHYEQPERVNGQVAIDLEAFDVDTGRAIVRAAADALAMDAGRLWQEARAEYERLRAISDAMPLGTEGEDEAVDAYCVAMDALIATPAPSIQAATYKLGLIQVRAEGGDTPESYWQALSADLSQLGGQA